MLSLPTAPPILFLFGLAASGKNFVGDLIHHQAGWTVYHADSDLTPEMKRACIQGEPFTDAMRDRYFQVVADRIREKSLTHDRLVVTQGAYKQKHREYLEKVVPGLQCVWIIAEDNLRLERLRRRGDVVTPEYEAKIRMFFEPPPRTTLSLTNNSDQREVERQLVEMFG